MKIKLNFTRKVLLKSHFETGTMQLANRSFFKGEQLPEVAPSEILMICEVGCKLRDTKWEN